MASGTRLQPGSFLHLVAWSALGGAVGLTLAFVLPKTYESRTVLYFSEPGAPNPETGRTLLGRVPERKEGAFLFGGQVFLPTVGTKPDVVIDILTSRSAAEEVAKKHGSALFRRQPTDRDVEDLTEAILVEITDAGQLRIGFRSRSRQASVDVVRGLISFAEARVRQLGREFARETLQFLEDEVALGRTEVMEHSAKLQQALSSTPIALLAGSRELYVEQLVASSAALRSLSVDLAAANGALDATVAAVRKANADGIEGEAYTQTTESLRGQILELQRRMDIAAATLDRGSPEMKALASSLEASGKTYMAELKRMADAAAAGTLSLTLTESAQRAGLEARLDATRRAVAKLRDDNLAMVDLQLEQRHIAADLARAEQKLDIAAAQLTTARLAEQKSYAPFVVLDPPYAPERPTFPRRGIFTLSGLGAGFFVGLLGYVRRLSTELSAQPPGA